MRANAAYVLVVLLSVTAIGPLMTAGASPGADEHPFFPFCIDWHDAKKRSFEQQAQMLTELGYPGVGHIWLDKVEERIKTLDAANLKLFQITMTVELAPGKTPYDANRFKEVCGVIKGRGVQFCLLLNGMKPSDPTVDPRAVNILRAMSDQARDSGAQLLLYPHQGSWVERIEDSVRVADKVARPNVGVMFNPAIGCAWIRVVTTSRSSSRRCPGFGPYRSTGPTSAMRNPAGITTFNHWTKAASTWANCSGY